MDSQILEWDTEFLGKRVARISVERPGEKGLREILSNMHKNGIRLAYWASPQKLAASEADALGGYLVDRKTTFTMDFGKLKPGNLDIADTIKPYNPSMPIGDLERLAVQSGEYSRFSVDPYFPKEKFVELYTTWIRKSLAKELADEVLTIQQDKKVVGMVTLGNKNGRGDIGLIAVEESCRGKGYGETLVRSAQNWFVRHQFKVGQIVTQGDNIPACKLYRKCGYSIEKTEYFYHFWL